jgi:hypothetical protein
LLKNITEFSQLRAESYVDEVHNKRELFDENKHISPGVVRFVDELFSNVFTTVAFQSALSITFISSFEQAFNLNCWSNKESLINDEFEIYLNQISKFFKPNSVAELKNLSDIFKGQVDGSPFDWKVIKTNYTFKSIVYPDIEMQPDQWPKYKYLLLEIWQPKNETLKNFAHNELNLCRAQVLNVLIEKKKSQWLSENQKHEEAMTPTDHSHVYKTSEELYKKLLSKLNHKNLTKSYFDSLRDENISNIYSTEDTDESDSWDRE